MHLFIYFRNIDRVARELKIWSVLSKNSKGMESPKEMGYEKGEKERRKNVREERTKGSAKEVK